MIDSGEQRTDTVVIGAGPSGLAVAACLRAAGRDCIILEKEPMVASSWRRHYERLHLHTVRQFSSLPHLPLPKDFPRYVPRQQMIDYLDGYAAHFGLRPRFGETVENVQRADDGWTVQSATTTVRARSVVVASGYNAVPIERSKPQLAGFTGTVVHSADYRNSAPFAGRSVLVIGMGNTGAEIALDLAEAGARPTISVRDGVHVVPRELFGMPIQVVAMIATALLPPAANNRIFPVVLDFALGDLSRFGVKRPRRGLVGPPSEAAKIPVIDAGTVQKIRDGVIKVAPAIARANAHEVTFADGGSAQFDAVILATGYRPNYAEFLPADLADGAGDATSGLYFVGFHQPITGKLRQIAREAMAVANDIARRQRR